MSAIKDAQSARTQLAGAATVLNNLAAGTFVVLGTIVHNSSGKAPFDTHVELAVTPTAVSGGRQVLLYAQFSFDGTNWTSGPTDGTSTTDETNLVLLGAVPANSASLKRKVFSIASQNNFVLPYATRLIAKNDTGAALAGAGNDVYTQDHSGDNT